MLHVASADSSRQQEDVFFHVEISSTLLFTGGFALVLLSRLGSALSGAPISRSQRGKERKVFHGGVPRLPLVRQLNDEVA